MPMQIPITVMDMSCPIRPATLFEATATEPYFIIMLFATVLETLPKIVAMLIGSPKETTGVMIFFLREIWRGEKE